MLTCRGTPPPPLFITYVFQTPPPQKKKNKNKKWVSPLVLKSDQIFKRESKECIYNINSLFLKILIDIN